MKETRVKEGFIMIAIVKTKEGNGNVSLVDVDEPTIKPDEVKIEVMSAGICGTDIKIYHGDAWSNPPVILGHEYSGVVVEIGAAVTSLKPGDRVVSETAQIICGHCYYCNTSNQLMCPSRLSIGYGVNGAFASHCVVREGIVHKLPDTISFDEGALCEPSAVAVHAVYDSVRLYPTDVAVIMGPGPIGLLVAQIVKGFGCTTIVSGMDLDLERLSAAKALGADYIVNVGERSLKDFVDQLTCGMGADVVYDCTGAKLAINEGLNCLKKMGKMVQVGLTKQTVEIEYGLLTQREISIHGTFGHNWKSWETAIKLIERKKLNVNSLITHHFKLREWEKAFKTAEEQQGIKLLFHPQV
jgi:L-iditol 2-dehydrogenase